MNIVETERLALRHLDREDAGFVCCLFNDPSFLENIGDLGIADVDLARRYIESRATEIRDNLGRGMYLVELKDGSRPIGICGLVKRDALADVDLGFALLPDYAGRGYALEAAQAVMTYARVSIGLSRLLAIVSPANHRSIKLLEKLGFVFEGLLLLGPDDEVRVYAAGP